MVSVLDVIWSPMPCARLQRLLGNNFFHRRQSLVWMRYHYYRNFLVVIIKTVLKLPGRFGHMLLGTRSGLVTVVT